MGKYYGNAILFLFFIINYSKTQVCNVIFRYGKVNGNVISTLNQLFLLLRVIMCFDTAVIKFFDEIRLLHVKKNFSSAK